MPLVTSNNDDLIPFEVFSRIAKEQKNAKMINLQEVATNEAGTSNPQTVDAAIPPLESNNRTSNASRSGSSVDALNEINENQLVTTSQVNHAMNKLQQVTEDYTNKLATQVFSQNKAQEDQNKVLLEKMQNVFDWLQQLAQETKNNTKDIKEIKLNATQSQTTTNSNFQQNVNKQNKSKASTQARFSTFTIPPLGSGSHA